MSSSIVPIGNCHRCKKLLSSKNERRIPVFFKFLAGLALGPVHAGMWIWEDLSQPYCAPCQIWISILTVLLASIVLGVIVLVFKKILNLKIL